MRFLLDSPAGEPNCRFAERQGVPFAEPSCFAF